MEMTEEQYALKDRLAEIIDAVRMDPSEKRAVLELLIHELPSDDDYSDE